MGMLLLDTNIFIAASKAHPAVLARLQQHRAEELLLSSVVWAELEFGIFKSARPEHNRRVFESIVKHLHMVPFSQKAARHYGELRVFLEKQGAPIGSNDILIAAEALAQGAILVTDNVREFSRVPGLRVENWLRETVAAGEA